MTTTNSSTETSATSAQPGSEHPRVVLERTLDAPRELVFKAWTDPEMLARWWGPTYFTNPVCELDVRPGGAILIHMAAPDGAVYPMTGEFNEIVPPERLVMTSSAFASVGGIFLLEDVTTVTFEEYEGKTKLTVEAVVTKAAPEAAGPLSGMEEGWSQSLDNLARLLETA